MKSRMICALLLSLLLLVSGCTAPDGWFPAVTEAPDTTLRVEFLDAGQADSIFITLPDRRVILIDGGNNKDGKPLTDYLKSRGVEKIDLMVATHPHEDHIGGLDVVLQNIPVGKIYAPKVADSDLPATKAYEDFLKAVQNGGYALTAAKSGMELLEEDGLRVECFAPNTDDYADLNNYSVVLKLTYRQVSFLFTGDAEKQSESEMLAAGYDLSADVLKVGHHGSDSSTGADFLAEVRPKDAVISCGEGNSYGHPHKETLDALAKAGVKVFRTDSDGTVIAETDGAGLNLRGDRSISVDGDR